MNGMTPMWDNLLGKIGTDTVYDAAADYGYDWSFVEDSRAEVSEDVSVEFWLELIDFIMNGLAPDHPEEVQQWLDEYEISEEDLEDYLS